MARIRIYSYFHDIYGTIQNSRFNVGYMSDTISTKPKQNKRKKKKKEREKK